MERHAAHRGRGSYRCRIGGGGELPGEPGRKAVSATELTRYDELEADRGVAALLIVVFHSYQQSRAVSTYGYEGTPIHVVLRNLDATVAWFFVLSGFLITLPFARAAVRQNREQSTRGFLI